MRADSTNPYVGLRPFDVDESLLFFGRDEQTLELLQRLHKHHFVAVVGSSGCGKSSLLRAGLIPSLKAGYLVDDCDNWIIAIMKPGESPLFNLAKSVLEQINQQADIDPVENFINQIREEGVDPLVNLMAQHRKAWNANFFLLVDQFEELFRFSFRNDDILLKDDAIDFVNIMLELAQQTLVPVYVVITMRSDFIGDCSEYFGLPEAMNKSLYLVPRLNRIQLKMVIEGPAKLYGGRLNASLTSLLINELGKVKDELPLLQHTLMRIWDFEVYKDKNGELDLEDYKKIGGLEKALSNHADEAITGMNEEEKKLTKGLFQALTSIDENGRKIRRPARLSELVQLTRATESQLLSIIQLFIQNKRSFLIISDVGDKNDKIIDISHESLIRQWDTLNKWVDEEDEAVSNYLQLHEATNLKKQGKKDYLTGSELQIALKWRDNFRPTAVWANRYKKGFEECLAYLNESEAERDKLLNKEKARRRNKRRLVASVIISLLLVVIVGSWGLYNAKKSEQRAKEALDQAERLARAFYFYDDKIALAYNYSKKSGSYYFINKSGQEIEKLGKWTTAEHFDYNGFAKVTRNTESFIIDTTGVKYKPTYNQYDITSSTEAADLSYLTVGKLPNALFSATNLKVLFLHYSNLTEFPSELSKFKYLKLLLMDGNSFELLPMEIGKLNNLTTFSLNNNKLVELPKEIGTLKNLNSLLLNNNNLNSVHSEIGKLKNLSTLLLNNNQLTTLPSEFWELNNLSKLSIEFNYLSNIPGDIGRLKNLKSLRLNDNPLTSLPLEFWELEKLEDLDLSNIRLTSLPGKIGKFKKLKSLYLNSNYLDILPKEIGELKELSLLDLGRNNLTFLPAEIGFLKNLKGLDLGWNKMSEIPTELWELKELNELYIDGTDISLLPKEIGELKNLTTLYVNSNKLTHIPSELCGLINLIVLDIGKNPLEKLPVEIGNLKNLSVLYLDSVKLSVLPKEIGKLKNLSELYLNGNGLKVLPAEIGDLGNLNWLDLSNNNLTEFPTEICKLTNLTDLILTNNNLTHLPIEIGQLKSLYSLQISGNKIPGDEIQKIRELLPNCYITE